MLRRDASQAAAAPPDAASEALPQQLPRKPRDTRAWGKRLKKRVVQKPDGRYLIYYDKA